jgi:hypothetical protein
MPRRTSLQKHTPFQAPKTCSDKRRFKNEAEAIKAAEFQMLTNMQLELRIYKCHQCQFWHLTRST